jgi:hypothetical protein
MLKGYKGKKVKLPLYQALEAHRVEISMFPHFLNNLLIDGGAVVSLTHQPAFNPRNIPGTHFC